MMMTIEQKVACASYNKTGREIVMKVVKLNGVSLEGDSEAKLDNGIGLLGRRLSCWHNIDVCRLEPGR